jgi:hypothetical protein
VAQWSSGGSSPAASAAVSHVKVSNQAPSASASTCQQVKDGHLWVGVSGNFLSLSKAGIIVGVTLTASPVSGLNPASQDNGLKIIGSGALYVATAATDGVDPQTTFGSDFSAQPASINLPAGLTVDLNGELPFTSNLQKIIPNFPRLPSR